MGRRLYVVCSVIGGVLGAAVAVLSHFLRRNGLPSGITGHRVFLTVQQYDRSRAYPSWLPSLPVYVVAGVVVGVLVALVWQRRSKGTALDVVQRSGAGHQPPHAGSSVG